MTVGTIAAAMACAGGGAPLVGVTHGMPQGQEADAGAPSPIAFRDGGVVDTTGLIKISPDSYTSVGHASGRFVAEVFANEAGGAVFRQGAGTFAVGSVFVMTHQEKNAGDAGVSPGPTFRMEKVATGWRYASISKEGKVLAEGSPESCVACHEDAPRDHVYPLLPK